MKFDFAIAGETLLGLFYATVFALGIFMGLKLLGNKIESDHQLALAKMSIDRTVAIEAAKPKTGRH